MTQVYDVVISVHSSVHRGVTGGLFLALTVLSMVTVSLFQHSMRIPQIALITLVNVCVALPVFTHIAGTS